MQSVTWQDAAKRLRKGEVGVIPTDTIYGVVGSALKPATVERIYNLRQRERGKPMIVLISSMDDLDKFHIQLQDRTRALLEKVWPGAVSVVVALKDSALDYLHRGTDSLAVRMPAKPELRELLKVAGPLVAPSANLAGEPPATKVGEAEKYFHDEVFYVDGGELKNPPSALVDARVFPPKVLRPGPGVKLQ